MKTRLKMKDRKEQRHREERGRRGDKEVDTKKSKKRGNEIVETSIRKNINK